MLTKLKASGLAQAFCAPLNTHTLQINLRKELYFSLEILWKKLKNAKLITTYPVGTSNELSTGYQKIY
jgi:hypothetical protein